MDSPVISCSGVSKTFRQAVIPSLHLQDHLLHWWRHRKTWEIRALDDVSFSVRKGEWLGLYGPNGSGKTTLMRILAGLLPPDAGTVRLEGSLSAFLGLGAGFHPDRSVTENVYLHGLLHGVRPKVIHRQMRDIIDFAGIETHRDVPVKCLSTGMMLRLAYAASAFIASDIYLFDETLAVGDKAFQEQCRSHLQSLRQNGSTVILVSHSLEELRSCTDRILFLEQGRMRDDASYS